MATHSKRKCETFTLACKLLFCIAMSSFAQGPQVGAKIPPFQLPDQTGTIQTLESIRGPKGAMLVFYRSADW